jgi:hypothetical protein
MYELLVKNLKKNLPSFSIDKKSLTCREKGVRWINFLNFFISLIFAFAFIFLSKTCQTLPRSIAFRKRHIGKKVQYKVRSLGSFEEWVSVEGVLTDKRRHGAQGGYDTTTIFRRRVRVLGRSAPSARTAAVSILEPSPAASRAQSRAASMERAAINSTVQQTSQQASDERRVIAELISQMRDSAAAERRLLLEEQRAAAAAAAEERRLLLEGAAQQRRSAHGGHPPPVRRSNATPAGSGDRQQPATAGTTGTAGNSTAAERRRADNDRQAPGARHFLPAEMGPVEAGSSSAQARAGDAVLCDHVEVVSAALARVQPAFVLDGLRLRSSRLERGLRQHRHHSDGKPARTGRLRRQQRQLASALRRNGEPSLRQDGRRDFGTGEGGGKAAARTKPRTRRIRPRRAEQQQQPASAGKLEGARAAVDAAAPQPPKSTTTSFSQQSPRHDFKLPTRIKNRVCGAWRIEKKKITGQPPPYHPQPPSYSQTRTAEAPTAAAATARTVPPQSLRDWKKCSGRMLCQKSRASGRATDKKLSGSWA